MSVVFPARSFLFWLAAIASYVAVDADVIRLYVGVILETGSDAPHDMLRSGAAIDLAVEKVNSEILNSDYQLVTIKKTFFGSCNASSAPGYAADMFYLQNVVAFVGPGCTLALDPVARLAGYWNKPIITGLGDSGLFKNKTDFQTLTRFSYCQCRLRKVFGSIFTHFNWTDITVILDRDHEYSLTLGETLDVGLQIGGYEPNIVKYYSKTDSNYGDILRDASEVSRIMIICAHGDEVRKFLITAHNLGYPQSGEYVFMDVEIIHFPGDYYGDHSWYRGDEDDEKAREAYEALIRIGLYMPTGDLYTDFERKVKINAKLNYDFDYDARGEQVNFFVGAFYDGIIHYGRTINKTLDTVGLSAVSDGYYVTRQLWNKTFEGVTGLVILDNNGDRDTNFKILDMNPETGLFEVVAYYWGDRPGYSPVDGKSIHWPGGRTTPPRNEPFCYFKGDNPACQQSKPFQPAIIALIVILCVVIVGGVIIFLGYRKYQANALLWDMSWLIPKEDVLKRNSQATTLSMISMGSGRTMESDNGEQLFGKVAMYKHAVVSLRESRTKITTISKDLMVEINKRLNLQHNNVARFIGIVLESEQPQLLHEYCPKGSLQDILHNESITLDSDFKRSLIDDIVRGMCYIHSSDVRYHGRLRSTNCVVDGRFVLKLTDFGLPTFYDDSGEFEDDSVHYQKMLWKAPELLRDGRPTQYTVKGDVYSFAIVLQEITTRNIPFEYERDLLTPKEIVDKVKTADPPFRPQIPKDCDPEICSLIKRCWDEDPESRPDFDNIRAHLVTVFKTKNMNLMDNLLMRMEQYANNLEHLVADRTAQLIQEQRKTEELLLQILPKSIADQLKLGKSVEPEYYDCVTIYFSDIVGFTTLSASSTPLEVVVMLNDLYTAFDSTIGQFDVYKVETIGDAYMVASGLPIRNGDSHASEIAKMSIELLETIDKFKIRHRPEEKLKLRIGLHSGSCVAGVVGLKMPRYCLFGDTVNTASRMESNGLPLKIHMSAQITRLLEKCQIFHISPRDEIEVKGKGKMQTYWLEGYADDSSGLPGSVTSPVHPSGTQRQ